MHTVLYIMYCRRVNSVHVLTSTAKLVSKPPLAVNPSVCHTNAPCVRMHAKSLGGRRKQFTMKESGMLSHNPLFQGCGTRRSRVPNNPETVGYETTSHDP